MTVREAFELVHKELTRAQSKFKPMQSQHEGYAVVLEELDETWAEIKRNNAVDATTEMKQVAAMAIRFLVDVGVTDLDETYEAVKPMN